MNTQSDPTMAEMILYNNWANQQVLEACKQLSEEQLGQAIPGAYGTLRATLAHIVRAETLYVKLLTGTRPKPPFDWDAKPSLDELQHFAMQVGETLADAVAQVRPTDTVYEVDEQGSKFEYRTLAVFIQIIEHGVEHRTNITTMLNQGDGHTPPPAVDGWAYLSAHAERFDYKAS